MNIRCLLGELVKNYARTSYPRIWVFLSDMASVLFSFFLTRLVFSMQSPGDVYTLDYFPGYFVILLIVYAVSFFLFDTYKGMLRYTGAHDLLRFLYSSLFCMSVLCLLSVFVASLDKGSFPSHAEIFMEIVLTFCILVCVRLFVRSMYAGYVENKGDGTKQGVLIFGAGSGGVLAQNIISQDRESGYKIVAFVDDNFKKVGSYIKGVPVLRPSVALRENYIRSHRIQGLIIAIPSMDVSKKNKWVDIALNLGLQIKVLPHVYEMMEGGMNTKQLKDVQIEDLLGRDPIVLEDEIIDRELCDKVILVTGAAGSIGSEIMRQIMNYVPSKVVALDMAETPVFDLQFELKNKYADSCQRISYEVADVRDEVRMEAVFSQYHPDIVFHAAAYKHVPLMEREPYEAVRTNVFGTKIITDLCVRHGVSKMVMVSTDKAVNPTNVMGASKRLAEIYVQSRRSATQFITTRFGNVLGSSGSVVPLFRKQLEKGGPLTVTDKRVVRYFMTIPEACNLVLQAASLGKGGEIYVFDMGDPVKIYDLACKMIRLSGNNDVKIKEIGLRPGEKLYEELLAMKENVLPTEHHRIFRAKVSEVDAETVDAAFDELQRTLHTLDEFAIVARMKAIVPEFISNNSRFSSLDMPQM